MRYRSSLIARIRAKRVSDAMMKMVKIDIGALEAAFTGSVAG
jgi:predicted 3-demethylubiquinone-9 3-methyltransferase (glyoxalase superfamily)